MTPDREKGDDAPGGWRFDRFVLDPVDRRLTRDGTTVELSGRYLDALVLLVSEPGRLVSKDRFLDQVWKGVPVTDEALTQCIRSLRKALGDDAARPRFIETAPRHGYRFIAPVAPLAPVVDEPRAGVSAPSSAPPARAGDWRRFRVISAAGMIGGGTAGLIGGLIYGLFGASGPEGAGAGSSSVLVLTGLTLWVGLVGGAGVGAGLGAVGLRTGGFGAWSVVGGALGGLLVGAASI